MPATLSYPGVYIEELQSPVRSIASVSTSVTAFIGRTRRGPADRAELIHSFAEFEQIFGGLWRQSPLSYAVQQYFLNGGRDAVIVRVHNGATRATITLPAEGDGDVTLLLEAANPGSWGQGLSAAVDHDAALVDGDTLFNLHIADATSGVVELHRNLSVNAGAARFITKVLERDSKLARVGGQVPTGLPKATSTERDKKSGAFCMSASSATGHDGEVIGQDEILGTAAGTAGKRGMRALDEVDIFNLLCIPPYHYDDTSNQPSDPSSVVWDEAASYCEKRRAILLVDPPKSWTDESPPYKDFGVTPHANAALYFPRLIALDPLQENRPAAFAPCGAIAGVIARTDANRGVWKAPAGIDAALMGSIDLSVRLTNEENGELNPLGINCLRAFDGVGRVSWGARTMRGADRLADQWKYLPVRRLALYIEESLYRGTQWVVFEPNDEPLWAQIRLNVGAFMQGLYRQGAFQGASPREAYLVKCDAQTTTQADINLGIVNILVGFAPLKPAEFVVIKIQQLAGQTQ